MVSSRVALVLLSCFAVGLVVAFSVHGKLSGRKNRTRAQALSLSGEHIDEDNLICHVELTLMALSTGGDEETFNCEVISTDDNDRRLHGMTVALDLPLPFVYEHRKALDTGLLFVKIPGGYVNEETVEGFGTVATDVHVPSDSTLVVLDSAEVEALRYKTRRQRRAAELEKDVGGNGRRSVMVIRVTTDDASPVVGATEIEERMFSDAEFSFASQFKDCSFGELAFQPYDTNTPVTELYVPGAVSSFTERTILNAATKAAAEIYGEDIFDFVDHAVFCMPDGTSGKPYIAYSGVGSFFSVYHDTRCAYPTTGKQLQVRC